MFANQTYPSKGWVLIVFWVALLSGVSTATAQELRGFSSLKELREQGVVMQQWDSSCAAATLATVLTYGFHDPVSERHAATSMLARTDPAKVKAQGGFSLLDMKLFVQSRGYQGSAYQYLTFDDLKLFHAPIVPIDNFGYNHYVVFNDLRGDVVQLADPAFGNRQMPLEQFRKVWIDGLAFVVTRQTSP